MLLGEQLCRERSWEQLEPALSVREGDAEEHARRESHRHRHRSATNVGRAPDSPSIESTRRPMYTVRGRSTSRRDRAGRCAAHRRRRASSDSRSAPARRHRSDRGPDGLGLPSVGEGQDLDRQGRLGGGLEGNAAGVIGRAVVGDDDPEGRAVHPMPDRRRSSRSVPGRSRSAWLNAGRMSAMVGLPFLVIGCAVAGAAGTSLGLASSLTGGAYATSQGIRPLSSAAMDRPRGRMLDVGRAGSGVARRGAAGTGDGSFIGSAGFALRLRCV